MTFAERAEAMFAEIAAMDEADADEIRVQAVMMKYLLAERQQATQERDEITITVEAELRKERALSDRLAMAIREGTTINDVVHFGRALAAYDEARKSPHHRDVQK